MTSLEQLKILAKKFNVEKISSIVLDDANFRIWTASSRSNTHHYGKYGLIDHTCEVIELCLLNNSYFTGDKHVNEQTLFLAALFHDIGKTLDYKPTYENTNVEYKEWTTTEHKYQIHHICRSVLVWHDAVRDNPEFSDIEDDVTHAILAHHGFAEWGSPVEPKTRLAWLLHLCDGISARMDDCVKRL